MKKTLGLLFATATLLCSPSARAAKFTNQFVEFELPPQWQCVLEGAEWVCQNQNTEKKREAIIVLAAKLKGPQDTLDAYQTYLNSPKLFTSIQNKPVKSELKYARKTQLNDQEWVDSMHMESEIPGFFTRYLATVKEDIAVLVTYSVNKDKYQQYVSEFENMVKTLRAFRKSTAGLPGADQDLFKAGQVPQGLTSEAIFPNAVPAQDEKPKTAQPKEEPQSPAGNILIWVLALGLIFYIWRKKQQG